MHRDRVFRRRLWGIVITSALASTSSVLADPPPSDSKASPGGPPKAAATRALLLPVRVAPGKSYRLSNLLMCEIPRQAFLIAARDELQIPTRDASLRESVDQAAEPSPLAVVSLISGDPAIPFKVNRDKLIVFCPKPRAVLWEGDLELDSDRSLEQLVARCEELSRTKFVELLAGGELPKAKLAEEDLPPPEHIERQLAEMDFVDQFAAVRALHRLIRERGESPRLLGALSHGYANLGLLTSCFMAPAHKVFFARSLLYAERLHARDHRSPRGLWRRAYARAIAGMHAAALEDLEAADKAAEGSKIARPDWAGTIDAFCRFDERALSEAAARQPLAGVFLLKSLFGAQRHALVLSTAQKLLEDRPDCYCLTEIGLGPEDYQKELSAKPPAPAVKQDAGMQ